MNTRNSQIILLILLTSILGGCAKPAKPAWKRTSFISRYDGLIYLVGFKGIQLYKNGTGVNDNTMQVGNAESSKDTTSTISLNYPLELTWILSKTDGTKIKRNTTIPKLEGVKSDTIEEACTIWVFFDEAGDVHLKYFSGSNMVNQFELFESIGRNRDGYLK